MTSRFDDETAVRRTGDGTYTATMAESWWVGRGPTGGFLAAGLLGALSDAVGDPARSPRSLTVHYANPAGAGEVHIATTLERVGRSMTTCSGRMEQDAKLIALALAAFSAPRRGIEFCDLVMPQVPGPQHYVARPVPPESPP